LAQLLRPIDKSRVIDDFAKYKRILWSHYANQRNANWRNLQPDG